MPGLELLTGFVTAPDTTLTALGMASGNSLTVRNAPIDTDIMLVQAWTDSQTAGNLRIRSPQMHDNVQGIRLRTLVSTLQNLLPRAPKQKLVTQDTLVVELSGSATAADIETACLLLYYDAIPGIEARLIDEDELIARVIDLVTIENTLALGTAGGYSGEEALNAEFDLLRANIDYAIVGYIVSAECAAVRWRGIDTGNLGIGGPGEAGIPELTRDWFIRMSKEIGKPAIPVFNSSNIAGLLIDGAQDENGTDVTVTTICAELSGG